MAYGNIWIGSLKNCINLDWSYYKYQPVINNYVTAIKGTEVKERETLGAVHSFRQPRQQRGTYSLCNYWLLSVNWTGLARLKNSHFNPQPLHGAEE